ncbi:MAG: NAD-dependent epimerase/dehydratase family protein, partial [Candidatus Lindowbacteria bacterium]|nr:NAD-dependent epimerase/dehydratase family protein [Candidatus Lindowbacteria bacterium]
KVLVTGGTGLIGRPLVQMLLDRGASVRIASLDEASRAHPDAEFLRVDLTDICNCLTACKGMNYVFHLAGVKGSPAVTKTRPASFFVPTILFNTCMMEAARRCHVDGYLYTSTVGVYSPADVFYEDDVWTTFPSENDRYAGWAKRMGELQAEAFKIEYNWNNVSIVRPANVYGPYDNFSPVNAMVVPSLIKRAVDGENPMTVWGDGSAIRDFIYTDDVARGMLFAAENCISEPINLGSGDGISIKTLVEAIVEQTDPKPELHWDTTKPSGDAIRKMDVTRAKGYGWEPEISISEGINRTMAWYKENKDEIDKRYNVFEETK